MRKFVFVAVGGFAGACLRFSVGHYHLFGGGFGLLNTLLPNLLGAFALGFFITGAGRLFTPSSHMHVGVTVGLLGALTTFSTLCGQTVRLARGGQITAAAIYAVGSVLLGLVFIWLGVKLAQSIKNPQNGLSEIGRAHV